MHACVHEKGADVAQCSWPTAQTSSHFGDAGGALLQLRTMRLGDNWLKGPLPSSWSSLELVLLPAQCYALCSHETAASNRIDSNSTCVEILMPRTRICM